MTSYVGTPYIERQEKAAWGIPCNQSADGELWTGKGFQITFESQFGKVIAKEVLAALNATRGARNGRFWINLDTRVAVMAYGESANNEYRDAKF